MLAQINQALQTIDAWVWGPPMLIGAFGLGLIYTIALKGLSIKRLPMALKLMFQHDKDAEGEVSPFGAICTTLAGNLGTGNIVGVATALVAGGPGALFWIWIVAALGMACKYAEGLLAVKYRTVDADGHALGGPFYYIERGLGKKWKPLASLFAFFGALACAGSIGTTTQINGIVDSINNVVDPNLEHTVHIGFLNLEYSYVTIIVSIVLVVVVSCILAGGLKRITQVAEIVVPVMAVIYVVYCLATLLCNIPKIPSAFASVFIGAFDPSAVTGGAVGSFFIVLQKGVARGVFSSETCLGSAPIAAAAAKTDSPVKQGLVTMNSNFFDTLVVCTSTGIAIIMTDAWNLGIDGVSVTTRAFQRGVPFLPEWFATIIMMLCLVFFAFTTIIGWEYYGERCWEYLFKGNVKACKIYRVIYVAVIFIGAYMTVGAIWTISDIFTAAMAFPNMIALLLLVKDVTGETRAYFDKVKC